METLEHFRSRVQAWEIGDPQIVVPPHLKPAWAAFCEGYEIAAHERMHGLIPDHEELDDMAADAYADHQRICAQTHRPRGYRCDLVSPFTVRSFTNELDELDRAVFAKMERDAVRQSNQSRKSR